MSYKMVVGRVDIHSKNVGYAGNGCRNAGRITKNHATNAGNGHYARDCPKPKVHDAKYFKEQMMLAVKDEAGVNLDTKENDFMFMNAYGNDQLEELNALVIMMVRIQRTDNKYDAEPTYVAEIINKVNASQNDLINGLLLKGDHEQQNHKKFESIKHKSVDDQIDSDIILMVFMWRIIVDKLNMIKMPMIKILLVLNP
nr:hypothetical protein [Tanacetum cinerariifolium]